MPKVSVIIPAYNSAAYIKDTVNSVLKQTFKDFDIFVIDDGSTDNTKEVLASYGERIHYFKKENGGPASARNQGIYFSKGEYIAFLDADDLWAPDKLELQVKAIEKNSDIGLLHTNVTVFNSQNQTLYIKEKSRIDSFLDLFWTNQIATSSALIRRRCLSQTGVFDEDPSIISLEDYDLWLRLASQFKIALINKPLLAYRMHGSGISRNTGRSYTAEEKVITKNYERFQREFPELKKLLPRRLAKLYSECGHDYFYGQELMKAREEFQKSLKHYPWNLKTLFFYGLTYLGESGVKNLKMFKKKIAN